MKVSENYYVGFRMIYPDLKMKNSELLSLFVDTAGIHSELCGNEFRKTDIRWLLTGYKVNVFKRPEFNDRLTVTTWARDIRNIRSNREFEVRNQKGELVVCALSEWVSFNQATKRLDKLPEEKISGYGLEPDCGNFIGESVTKLEDEKVFDKCEALDIDWRFCDLIGHVNNTSYIDIAENVIGEELRKKIMNMSFEVVYKKEIKNGAKVKVFVKDTDDYAKVIFKNEDETVIHAMVKYYKKTSQ